MTGINKRKQTYRFTVKLHVHHEGVCALFLPYFGSLHIDWEETSYSLLLIVCNDVDYFCHVSRSSGSSWGRVWGNFIHLIRFMGIFGPPPSWKISGSAPNLCVVVYSLKEYFIQITNQFYCFCPSRKPFLVFMIFLKHFINTATI